MTIIVVKDGMMCADSACTSGQLTAPVAFPKITRLPNGWLLGGCGYTADIWSVFEWHRQGQPSKHPTLIGSDKDTEVDFLIMKPDGSVWRNTKGVDGLYPVQSTFAIGESSACNVAEAAMRLGKSAEEAVALACEMCVSIYGPVQVERLHPALAEAAE